MCYVGGGGQGVATKTHVIKMHFQVVFAAACCSSAERGGKVGGQEGAGQAS